MIVLFRLALQSLRSLRAQRLADVTETSRVHLRIMPNDLDLNGHVNNGRIYSLADLGRMDWFIRSGSMRVALRERWMPVVGDSSGRFIRQMKVLESFALETTLLGWDHKWLFMEHRMFRADGQLAAIIAVRTTFVPPEGGTVTPARLFSELGLQARLSPPLPEWMQTWLAALNQLSQQGRQGRSH